MLGIQMPALGFSGKNAFANLSQQPEAERRESNAVLTSIDVLARISLFS